MKLFFLPLLFLSANVFAQGALLPADAMPESSLTLKKEILVGPKTGEQVDLFFVDGKLYNAKDFINKSRNHELKNTHSFCLLTVDRDVFGEAEMKRLPVGKQVSFGDKEDLGPRNMIVKDHLGNKFGVGNGYDGAGYFKPSDPNAKLERFNLIDEKGTLKYLYCFSKIWSFNDYNAGWTSSIKDQTIKQAMGDYVEPKIVVDQSLEEINQGGRNQQNKTNPDSPSTPKVTVTEG